MNELFSVPRSRHEYINISIMKQMLAVCSVYTQVAQAVYFKSLLEYCSNIKMFRFLMKHSKCERSDQALIEMTGMRQAGVEKQCVPTNTGQSQIFCS